MNEKKDRVNGTSYWWHCKSNRWGALWGLTETPEEAERELGRYTDNPLCDWNKEVSGDATDYYRTKQGRGQQKQRMHVGCVIRFDWSEGVDE